jgi:hypothetical protein
MPGAATILAGIATLGATTADLPGLVSIAWDKAQWPTIAAGLAIEPLSAFSLLWWSLWF